MEESQLEKIKQEVLKLLGTKINDIIVATRKGADMIVLTEKTDGDSITEADAAIGDMLDAELVELVPESIVIQEESFNEHVFKKIANYKYIWVVDPIDGTKAFRIPGNTEWGVGICLLEDLSPILSFVYSPERLINKKPFLFVADKYHDGIYLDGKRLEVNSAEGEVCYTSHVHRAEERNETENKLAELFPRNKMIRAYDGYSTLMQFAFVALDVETRVFSRRGANIWDIIQSAYLVEKQGGQVYYKDGTKVFPLDLGLLKYEAEDDRLVMPFTVASSTKNKEKITALFR